MFLAIFALLTVIGIVCAVIAAHLGAKWIIDGADAE